MYKFLCNLNKSVYRNRIFPKKGQTMMDFAFKCMAFATAITFSQAFSADTLSVWIMPNGASPQEKLEQRLEAFTAKNRIPTKVEVLDWGEAWNRISTALETGNNLPDVLQLGTTWVPYFAARGELMPLNPHLDKFKPERFVPASYGTAHIDSDSTIYSIPWFIDIRPVLGNKRIMKKYGISGNDIQSYNGFVKAVAKVNQGKELLEDGAKVRGFAFPGKSDWNIPHNFAPWIWSNGGDFIEKDEKGKWRASILKESTLHGIAKYLKFIVDTLVTTETLQLNTAQIAQQFNNGELAFIVNTAEIVMQTRFEGSKGGLSNARIGEDSVAVFAIPRGSSGSISFIGGSNLAIPAKNKRKEAIKLLQFLTNDENLDAYTRQIGFLPASKDVLKSWAEDEAYKNLVDQLDSGKTYPAIPEWGDIEQSLVSMFSTIWELLEIPALYSDEKIYQTFKEYSDKINNRLGYTPTKIMTFAEFQAIWDTDLKTSKNDGNKDKQPQEKQTNGINPTPYIFFFVLILSFLFSYNRKRKR